MHISVPSFDAVRIDPSLPRYSERTVIAILDLMRLGLEGSSMHSGTPCSSTARTIIVSCSDIA